MQTNESEEGEKPIELLPDFVLAMVLSMLTTSDLLHAMVLTCFHDPLPLTFQRLFAKGGCSSLNTNRLCGKTGLSVFACNQKDSRKFSVHFRKRTFLCNIWKQQVTRLETLVLRAFREHSKQTLHSNHLIFRVCCFVQASFTQQVTTLELLVLRAFREHSNQTLHSPHLILVVC